VEESAYKKAMVKLVDLKTQYDSIKEEADSAVQSVINDSAFIKGPYLESFEKNFAEYLGAKHCIGVASGTDALAITLKCAGGIEEGSEIIIPANSFIATAEAASLIGAKPVFVDCNTENYNIDVSKIESAITEKTKAIIPVHLYGQPAEMDEIMTIAKKHNLLVIEDAAQAHGAEYKGSKVGTIGDVGCFSFYPAKPLGAYGDGGAIVTNDDALAEKIRMFRDHGRKSKYEHEFEGTNSRLGGLQAAVLDVKLKHLDEWNEKRKKVAERYNEELKDIVKTLARTPDTTHVYHLYVIQIENRDEAQKKLKAADIETGIHYPIPLPSLEAYKHLNHKPEDFPIAHELANKILSIPVHEMMGEEQVNHVIETIKKE
jgi:dTDP-4-amino-4,6-dideoxygalactose transaminase